MTQITPQNDLAFFLLTPKLGTMTLMCFSHSNQHNLQLAWIAHVNKSMCTNIFAK